MAKKTGIKTAEKKTRKQERTYYHSYGAQGVCGATHICACGQDVTGEVECYNQDLRASLASNFSSKCEEPRCSKCKKILSPGGVSVAT